MRSIALRMATAVAVCALTLSVAPAAAGVPTTRIDDDTTWTAGGGPYVLDRNVIVMPGATLTIEPGTRVKGNPGAVLIVRGVLLARGTQNRPITFTSAMDDRWHGIRLVGTGTPRTKDTRSAIRGAVISDARTAISALYDSPLVAGVTFRRNTQALLLVLPAADVAVRSSQFLSNGSAVAGRTTRSAVTVTRSDFWNNDRTLLAGHKRPYDCGPDAGVWRLASNDLLRGPDQPWHAGDLFALPGSGNSGVTIDVRDNHWGTSRQADVAGRIREHGEPYWGSAAGDATRKTVLFDPLSPAPHTPWTPPGPVGSPESDASYHSDPASWSQIERPQQGRCYQRSNLTAIRGEAGGALGSLHYVKVAVRRQTSSGCAWLRNRAGTFERRRCNSPVWLDPDGLDSWRLPLPQGLPPGRYVALSQTDAGSGNGLGEERMQFTITP